MLRSNVSSHPSPARRLGSIAALAALLPLAACADDPDPEASAAGDRPIPVVLDYSPTVSDAGALLYLAAHPDVELLAVTLPSTGEADCEPGVRITQGLLTIAGRGDVPIACGAEVPAEGRNEWPAEWRDAANHLPGVVLPGVRPTDPLDAEQLLADVLGAADEPVTVVAVAPLTNLALVLAAEPALADRIERIVTMGGAVDVPGNVEAAPSAEWNYHVDPAAARDVLASGVDVLVVPLDATDDVPWTRTLVSRIGTSAHPVARAEHQIVSTASLDGIYLWDELAAIAALEPSVVTVEEMTLAVDDVGALTVDPDGATVAVATATDVDAATTALLRSLNGGEPLLFDDLTAEETAYFDALAATITELTEEFENMGEPPASATSQELATALVDVMWGVLAEIDAQLAALSPPAAIQQEHADFAATVAGTLAIEDALLAAIERSDGDDPWMILERAMTEIGSDEVDRLLPACRAVEDYAIVRGGPDVCGLFGE